MEIVDKVRYTGLVVRKKNGYGFVGRTTVKMQDGQEVDMQTSRDIFIHDDDCNGSIVEGATVSFDVLSDQERKGDALRAVNAELIDQGPMAGTTALTLSMGSSTIGRPVTCEMHALMKPVSTETVTLVNNCHPLQGLDPNEVLQEIPSEVSGNLQEIFRMYLQMQYNSLASVGLTFEVQGHDESTQDKLVNAALKQYTLLGMSEQSVHLSQEYECFKRTRLLLQTLMSEGLLTNDSRLSPQILGKLLDFMNMAKQVAGQDTNLIKSSRDVVSFMLSHDLMRVNSIVPMDILPDLFLACPVWYWAMNPEELQGAEDSMAHNDPVVHNASIWMMNRFKSNAWADIYQMFNRRRRPLSSYKGDQIPAQLLTAFPQAIEIFDYVVIMTPYLDVAGMEWTDPEWLRSIDPYIVGFKKGLPVFFVIGRFSDTGVFPLHSELVADTIDFLRSNKSKLMGFNAVQEPYWYQQRGSSSSTVRELGNKLTGRVDQLLSCFESGNLFRWIKTDQAEPDNRISRR